MIRGLPKKLSRLSRMGWDEVRGRAVQAASKRLDLVRYRYGLLTRPAQLVSAQRRAKFFFSEDERQGRVAILQKYLPEAVEQIILEAEAICRHEFDLLGYHKLDYGAKIDWHLDAVHQKRAPLKPWFKIDFLDFSQVGDHKITWELNRHQHLVTLAKAWCITGNARYAEELGAQWYSWQRANPYPLGINWGSSLEVAFRSMSWLWIRHLLAGSKVFSEKFETDLLQALGLNARYIKRYLSTYFSPNTHLLGEAAALFFMGTLCPEISGARDWQAAGWDILLREAQRQVRPDGIYFEQALYYHVYALDFFLHTRVLAARNEVAVTAEFDAVVGRMLDALYAICQAGASEGFGDDDGGRVFNTRRNRVEHMSDPLALGGVLFQSAQYRRATALTEEAVWLFGESALERFADDARPVVSSQAFESGGIYLMADREPCVQQLMIDAGPQGTGHSGHGHADALSLRLSVNGRRILIDPGTYVYISDTDERNLFRGTRAHNTVAVDGVDQAIPEGPFAWRSIPEVKSERWVSGETFDLFVGSHNGYRRLNDPVLHRRFVFHAKGGFWFVRDVLEGRAQHLLESFWHFAPGLDVTDNGASIIAGPSGNPSDTEPVGLAVVSAQNSSWTREIISAPVSSAYGQKESASAACFRARVTLPAETAVVLVPQSRTSVLGELLEIQENQRPEVRGYSYVSGPGTSNLFFSEGNQSWKCGGWSSDAAFLYCHVEDGRLMRLVLISGSFAKWHEKELVTRPSKVESFEWMAGADSGTFSSDGRAVAQPKELDPVV